ncbi:co-chaperone GrpE [Peptostreptococcus stomatis DSM 17678]|uniref:Protein GrpE n=1 Tax=Peptostreptococcus stomatis DSM 17678 TaxID=596315 RepID=E0E461_9FIRM|nr:nucleotide exchange factor GrpE [Peptostreptococcus stomatis]EFM64339.1 co-chaperone GrpE [Peptostreptococcus stomatis DSM 17678]
MDKERKDPIDKDEEIVQEDIKNETSEEILVEDGQDLVNEEKSGPESEGSDQENIDECEPDFKIKSLENKIKDQEEAILRLNAEYANFRRRTAEEKATIGLYANEKVFNELIPVIDNMKRALEACEDKESPLFVGVDMVYKQLLDALKSSGLESIDAELGQEFDPNLHMAVMQEASDEYEPGKILMVLQKGYKLDKKVLRASMVKVSC